MARLYVRSGLDPDEPDAPVAVLVADPDGTPGEQAVERLGGNCYEGDEVLYLVQTDGWAEHAYADGRLTVGIAVHPAVLARTESSPADFPLRSAADPEALVVLRAEAAVAPEVAARLSEGTMVLVAAPDTPLDDLLGPDGDWPMLLAPPPAQP
ncbi:hypothetical protein [Streptomyces sp. CBMA156]|uniref:hypothetical protein n=1 Tax=Streptomyces sp. CBMA156 TaxID=1930280 RepID=UPI00166196A9|nr:hypothetical protein [Streptomyces sp. CBMA156]MBD0669178.1 hypothetical protein [Streptomyces sp. CBMA156]